MTTTRNRVWGWLLVSGLGVAIAGAASARAAKPTPAPPALTLPALDRLVTRLAEQAPARLSPVSARR